MAETAGRWLGRREGEGEGGRGGTTLAPYATRRAKPLQARARPLALYFQFRCETSFWHPAHGPRSHAPPVLSE